MLNDINSLGNYILDKKIGNLLEKVAEILHPLLSSLELYGQILSFLQ